jgi:predicted permease
VRVQVALSLVLAVGAILLVRTLDNLRSVDPGFRPKGVLFVHLFSQPRNDSLPNRAAYYWQLAERLEQLPGVESVNYSRMGPFTRSEFRQPVAAASSQAALESVVDFVGPGFFHWIGMRLLAGREFHWGDNEDSPRVVILSEALARRLFPEQDPVGRRINLGQRVEHRNMEIVGVVNSASLWTVRDRDPLAVYLPLMQERASGEPMAGIRAAGDLSSLTARVRRTIESMGRHSVLRIQTSRERADTALVPERVMGLLSAFCGGLALLLASIGIYGLTSYSITRRTSEIGIRMALGARPRDVLGLVLREVSWLVVAGIAAGIPAALVATRLLSGMLYGLSSHDPATIALALAILTGVSICAGYLPARRASRLDPMSALRCQ